MHHHEKFPPKRRSQPNRYLLEHFSADSIGKSKQDADAICKYHWKFYGDLVIQRYRALPAIKEALLSASEKDFPIEKWQRAMKYRWGNKPLSARGSLQDPGGRFNIGEIDTTRFPPFSGLYIASDKETSIQEILLGSSPMMEQGGLTPYELALSNPASITVVSVSGNIETVINLQSRKSLKSFVEIINDFEIDKELSDIAKSLGLPPPKLVRTTEELMNALLEKNWRQLPMFADVPSTSQIFGQLVMEAGIGGIIYPSVLTQKFCGVIFYINFKDASSFIQLDDTPPRDDIVQRVDANNWKGMV